jgi:outer membrane protein assembly factor BamB
MADNGDLFTPDEIDEQIDEYLTGQSGNSSESHIIQTLQHHFAPDKNYNQILERVWQRLEHQARLRSAQHEIRGTSKVTRFVTAQQLRRNYMKDRSIASRNESKSPGKFAMMAAVVFLTLLVGSMVAVFQLSHQGRSSLTGQAANCAIASSTQSSAGQTNIYALVNNTVYRLNGTTYKQVWSFHMPPIGGSVYTEIPGKVVNGIYYILGTNTDGYYFYALNIDSGTVDWQFKLDDTPQLAISANPIIINGAVYISESSITNGYSILTALNASTGKIQWQHHYNDTGISSAQKQGGNFATGLQIQAATNTAIYATNLTVKNGIGALNLFAINATDGSPFWQTSLHTNEQGQGGQVVNGVFYLTTGFAGTNSNHTAGRIYAYDAARGVQLWNVSLDGQPYRPAVLSGIIYIGTVHDPQASGGSVYALRAADGSQIWRYNAPGGVSAPIVENGAVYITISHNDGSKQAITAIDASKGTLCWSHRVSGQITLEAPPAVDNNFIYLSTSGDKVNILHASDGSTVSAFVIGGKPVSNGSDYAQLTLAQ